MKTKTAPLRFVVSITVVAACSLLTGCVGVMPIPTTSKVEYGRKVTTEQANLIRPGKTTRAEVIEKLGTNYSTLPMNKVMAYTWELQGGGGVWWYSVVIPTPASVITRASGNQWAGGWRGFFVAFDDQDLVRATVFKQLSTRHSLHKHMDQWSATLPAAMAPVPAASRASPSSPP